ncbi:MAG: hypothetical protein OXQ31_27985 [Spirochaetaceae bacterium]|nr:hypothetical protein [Spirochaetaceae bacterium]
MRNSHARRSQDNDPAVKMQGPRLLSEKEFDRLDRVLADLAAKVTVSTSAAGALRFLMLTDCRPNEIVTLKWEHLHLEQQSCA